MERFQELMGVAKKKLQIADHMLTQTYPLVRDPRLLVTILENIFLALTNSMGSILYYERLFKRIPPFQDNFNSKFNMFRQKCTEKYKIDKVYLYLIEDVKNILYQHKKSPVEFSRKDSFVICSEDYKMKVVTVDEIRGYLNKTKLFIQGAYAILKKEAHRFNI